MEFMRVTEEVLRQHWKQILQIFQKSLVDQDDISCVISHFHHAVTLLTNEVASHDRPGPVLLYFISESILDTFFIWSLSCPEYASELKYHQLRCFEFLLSPFLRTIFSKLENMLQNPLHVNLLLTGIISRLAHYSQPLLRSLLLNHSLVLETNVKSLFQILSNLKSKLETISQTYNDFNNLVQLAHETLYQRENNTKESEESSRRTRSPSRTRSKSADPGKEPVSKRTRIMNFFRGRSRVSERVDNNIKERDYSQVTLIDKTSMKFINIRENHQSVSVSEWDDPKTRNIAYCAVIFNEFLKELAAITLEHSVQQFDDDQIFDDISSIQLLY
ncbi:unnamed protein product [Adineta steineri]|uniref:FHF complex subunit HOOK-interacting protein C-terminal domain-containing protein n=1 Tax=Adineta steineri TaxID=433720 RepID=A0A814XSE9_9BILA|nr:unnamed protein product [Adineta steineri]